MKKNILVIFGGQSEEHDVSLVSAKYIIEQIDSVKWNTVGLKIEKNGSWTVNDRPATITSQGEILIDDETMKIDVAVPVCHGHPGETGHLAAFLEIFKIPTLGSSLEASVVGFNKISTKLWLEKRGIKTSPFEVISSMSEIDKGIALFKKTNDVFVKASNQGSSVGCYHVTKEEELTTAVKKALELSPYCVVESTIKGRELEVSVWELDGEVYASKPGEILCNGDFYSYEEKYSGESSTETLNVADLPELLAKEICKTAVETFKWLKLGDYARVDFFLSSNNQIIVNEVNTSPGLTPISMFPKMMEQSGLLFKDFINKKIESLL